MTERVEIVAEIRVRTRRKHHGTKQNPEKATDNPPTDS